MSGHAVPQEFGMPTGLTLEKVMLADIDVPITEQEYRLLRTLVYEETGISLGDTKRALLNNRLLTRLRHHGYDNFMEYYEHVKNDDPCGAELQQMINAVTTNMTSFFREKHHFECLAQHVLRPAQERALRGMAPSLRIWSAGCSSGEEPYSIAITLMENLERLPTWDVKVLATDIDTEILDIARQGIYSRESVSNLTVPSLKRYFLCGKGEFEGLVQVKPPLQQYIKFGRLNLMGPWPFHGKFDAIFCRNVIIYFDYDCQQKVIERFLQCLKPDGLLFAGHSENLFWLRDKMESVGHTAYRLRSEKAAS